MPRFKTSHAGKDQNAYDTDKGPKMMMATAVKSKKNPVKYNNVRSTSPRFSKVSTYTVVPVTYTDEDLPCAVEETRR